MIVDLEEEMIVDLVVEMIVDLLEEEMFVVLEMIAEKILIKVDHLGDQVLDHGGIVNARKMQNGNQEAVMTMVDHQDVILTDNRHPEDQMMRVIGAESLEMIVVLGMIVAA